MGRRGQEVTPRARGVDVDVRFLRVLRVNCPLGTLQRHGF